MVTQINRPSATMTTPIGTFSLISSAYRHSISSTDTFSLKFCTAIEWPADSSTCPRCCSSAFIGTTK
ncbi:hypothetical protein D3C72_1471620 [compost metagenome]